MFKRSLPTQLDVFKSSSSFLSGKALDIYDDANSWHNQFEKQVTSRIDETIFSPLYSKDTGSPNASIKVMLSMMILKEARGISDEQLFENCRFNILTRGAIGLLNIDDTVPSPSTYYAFRKKVNDYAIEKGENLFDTVFTSITQHQSLDFNVSGKRIRMDSKLLGSNIAWLSRYELVHETFRLFLKKAKNLSLSSEMEKQLEPLKTKGNKIVYMSTNEELTLKFKELGVLISKVLAICSADESVEYKTLKRVFEEQFDLVDTNVIPKEKQKISAKSIQSPHDTDCDFRNKDGNKVKGYSINVTESCDDAITDKDDVKISQLNLIAEVSVKKASVPDVVFLESGVDKAEEVFCNNVKDIHADGAYHSTDNQEFCSKKDINLHLHAIQGAKSRYSLRMEKNELIVLDTQTNQTVESVKIKDKKGIDKWRIKTEKGYRYFTQKEIDNSLLRTKIEETPLEVLQKRNNVEATIFQLGYHYFNSKSRYRGLERHQMWANMRCLWVNFVRLLKFIRNTALKFAFFQKNQLSQLFQVLIFAFKSVLEQQKSKIIAF